MLNGPKLPDNGSAGDASLQPAALSPMLLGLIAYYA